MFGLRPVQCKVIYGISIMIGVVSMYPVFRKKAFCARGYLAEKTDTRDNAIESEINTFFLRYFLRCTLLFMELTLLS